MKNQQRNGKRTETASSKGGYLKLAENQDELNMEVLIGLHTWHHISKKKMKSTLAKEKM